MSMTGSAAVASGISKLLLGLLKGLQSIFTFVGGHVTTIVLNGGASLFTIAAGIWMAKYFWGIVLVPFLAGPMHALGLGGAGTFAGVPVGSTMWIPHFVLAFLLVNGLNLAFADYRHGWTLMSDIGSSVVPFGVVCYAWIDSYRGLLHLAADQQHALWAFTWMVLIDFFLYGRIATRLNRLYFGDLTNAAHQGPNG